VMHRRFRGVATLRILDVGCGDGLFFGPLAQFGEVEGVEPDEGLVSSESPHRARIRTARFDTDFRPPEPYSLVLMLDVLEHLDDPGEALRHAYSLLAAGGGLLLTVPAFQVLWTNHDVINHHRVRYRRATLRPLLWQAGFVILEERYWFQWTCPLKLAIRLSESVFHSPSSIARVPVWWVNFLLYWISRIEQQTLGAIGMPFGSTLMVYCAKQRTP
jgi:SAM-dependent methyltransferase